MERTKLRDLIKNKLIVKAESKIPDLVTNSKKYISINNDNIIQ